MAVNISPCGACILAREMALKANYSIISTILIMIKGTNQKHRMG